MKKQHFIVLFLILVLSIVCTGCDSSTSTLTPTQSATPEAEPSMTEAPNSTIITKEPTTVITATPSNTSDSPEPTDITDTPVDTEIFKNTYWINSFLEIGYFFGEDGSATVYMTKTKSECAYSFSKDALTLDETSLPYSIKDDQLIITFFDGLEVALDKATKDQFDELIKEPDITPEPDMTADSEYIGLTVKEFIKTGADISGYTGFNGEYKFSAYNSQKNEKYTFSLIGGDIKEALDSKTFDNEYEDVLGDFVISKITVVKLNNTKLQKYVGKTISEFEGEGFEINGFMYISKLTLLAYDENNNCVKITLNGNANEVYESLEDPFDEDMGDVFAQFTIKSIEYYIF